MHLEHWGLERSPFLTVVNPASAYPTPTLEEAIARIEHLVDERRRVGAVLGDRGHGKSTALAAAAARLSGRGVAACVLDTLGIGRRELLAKIAEGLAAGPDPGDDEPRLWRRIGDRVQHIKWQGQSTAILLDDIDRLGPDQTQQIARLTRVDPAPDARLTVILSANPASLGRLDEALLHAIDLRIDMHPWTLEDATGYLQHALVEAGRFSPVFDDAAIERIHARAEGSPRHIVRLADAALEAGAHAHVELVDAGLVEHAFDGVRWSPPAAVG